MALWNSYRAKSVSLIPSVALRAVLGNAYPEQSRQVEGPQLWHQPRPSSAFLQPSRWAPQNRAPWVETQKLQGIPSRVPSSFLLGKSQAWVSQAHLLSEQQVAVGWTPALLALEQDLVSARLFAILLDPRKYPSAGHHQSSSSTPGRSRNL